MLGLGIAVNGQPLTGTAKWADILKVYEIDTWYVLHNVTERHLKPFAQEAVIFNVAAQVISNTVAAAVATPLTAGKEKCFQKFRYVNSLVM
jgi:hypothetical protein